MQAGNIIGTGSFIPNYKKPDPETGQSNMATPFWGVGASGAEVEVDTETGDFKITKLINVADVGVAINPKLVKVQLSGAGIMQLGFTTTEEMTYPRRPTNERVARGLQDPDIARTSRRIHQRARQVASG